MADQPTAESIRGAKPVTQPWERDFAMATHLITIVTPFVGPLILWLVKRDQSHFVDDHGKEVLNFHLSLLIYGIVITLVTCGPGAIIAALLYPFAIVFTILAALAAHDGRYYRYPVCLRFIR